MSMRLAFAVTLISTVLLAAACGGTDEHVDPMVDAAVDGPGGDGPITPMPTAIAVAGDFNVTGILSRLDVASRTMTPNALAGVAGGDPYLRVLGNELFIVNRASGENITVVRRSPLGFVDQFGTGGGSNPRDVAVVGDKLYVPALGTAGVVVIDRTTRATTTISLASLDPDDGKPDCVSAYAVGDRVFVSCGLLDQSFMPRGNGRIAVIDTTDDSLVTDFELPFPNPLGNMVATPPGSTFGGDLLVPTVPSFTDTSTGCLVRVSTGSTPAANGCAVTNQDADGYLNHVDVSPDGDKVWLASFRYSADFSMEFGTLRAIDLTDGTLGPVVSNSAHIINDVAACPGGYVVAADATFGAAGLRVYKDGSEQTTTALDIGRATGPGNGLVCY